MEKILEELSAPSNQYGWCLPPDQARRALNVYSKPLQKALYQAIGVIENEDKTHPFLEDLKKTLNYYKQ